MRLTSRLSSLVRNIFARTRVERDLDHELRAYLEMAAEERRRAGLPEGDARRGAFIELQGLEQVKEEVRAARSGALVEQLLQDLSYAIRMFLKNRGFTSASVLTLALGIGAGTAIFSLVDTVIYRPLPYSEPGRLVKICGNALRQPKDDVSFADFADIRDRNQVFERIAADDGKMLDIVSGGVRQSVYGAVVTADWLSTLGVQPMLGRSFLPEEARPEGNRVLLLTAECWRRRFESDPRVVGRTVAAKGETYAIVGVLPPNVLRYEADFLTPLVTSEYPVERSNRDLDVFARLRPGVTLAGAQAELDAIGPRLEAEYPATNKGRRFSVVPLDKYYANIGPKTRQGLLLMLGAVGLVLLIACVNVASLLLARALTRGRECVIRAALGASRGRLVRQLLVENVLLFLAGGTLGTLLARWTIDWLRALAVTNGYVPQRLVVAIDGRVLGFSLAVSLAAGVIFGLGPALRASRVDLSQGLRDAGYTSPGGRRHGRGRRVLVVSELALSLVLLTGFGLLGRSFARVQATGADLGVETLLETSAEGGRSFSAAMSFWGLTLAEVRALPGVEYAAVSSRPPVHGARQRAFGVDGQAAAAESLAGDIMVSADYFRALRIPLLQGRSFTDGDNGSTAPVVVVSQALARRAFPGADPIGRRIRIKEEEPMICCTAAGPLSGIAREIVGVVGDIRQANLDEPPAATIYRPYSQIVEHDMYLLVRTRTPADAVRLARELRGRLPAAGPGADWTDPRSMQRVIGDSESIRLRRFILILLGGFAALALLLAGVGLYGVTTYSVAERRREIGIRVALGATPPAVFVQVLGEAMRVALSALVVGAFATYFLARGVRTMLFGVGPADAVTYLGVWFFLAGVVFLAAFLPARRAAHVDPMTALKE